MRMQLEVILIILHAWRSIQNLKTILKMHKRLNVRKSDLKILKSLYKITVMLTPSIFHLYNVLKRSMMQDMVKFLDLYIDFWLVTEVKQKNTSFGCMVKQMLESLNSLEDSEKSLAQMKSIGEVLICLWNQPITLKLRLNLLLVKSSVLKMHLNLTLCMLQSISLKEKVLWFDQVFTNNLWRFIKILSS